mmetsp:Transcript_11312/g.42239  ORF Transcript_11312/g.42239 Transcript_11312/m.42239 type:complete len:246 (-) Transcript_11312:856-1593(-)
MPTAPFIASSTTSESVGCVCTIMLISRTVVPAATALEHSWMRSAAFKPMMCTPRIFSVSLLKSTFAMPSPSSSARAFELARKWPTDLPSSKPSALARSTACSSVRPTKAMFGCVKQAAGIASWSTTCSCPTMFSTALIPWAEAACASIILPLASPMHQRPSTTSPSGPVSTCIFSFTCTNPRTVSMPFSSRPRFSVFGLRPVATMQASTSSVSTCSFVLASIISMVTGFTPGTAGVTLEAKTPVR